MDTFDRYLRHFRGCPDCKPATAEDPVCVPCPTGQKLWNRHEAANRIAASGIDDYTGPSCYPLGGLDEYHDD